MSEKEIKIIKEYFEIKDGILEISREKQTIEIKPLEQSHSTQVQGGIKKD